VYGGGQSMRYGFFLGCNIPVRIDGYERCAENVLRRLGCELITFEQFTCCGYPMRNIDQRGYLLPSARNMALAEKAGVDLLVLCNCCYHSLQKAKYTLANEPALVAEFNAILEKEGLHYHGTCRIRHLYSALYEDIGADLIQQKLQVPYEHLRVCVIQGCHLLRPREVVQYDNSFMPQVTANLLNILGIKSLDWSGELECCGAALAGINDDLATALLEEKLAAALKSEADLLVSSCSYCFLQLDRKQPARLALPVLFYLQLLGLCMGMNDTELGFDSNQSVSDGWLETVKSKLASV